MGFSTARQGMLCKSETAGSPAAALHTLETLQTPLGLRTKLYLRNSVFSFCTKIIVPGRE